MIRELKEENERLRKELASGGGGGGGGGGADPAALKAAQEAYEANLAEIEAKSRSWEEQLQAAKKE